MKLINRKDQAEFVVKWTFLEIYNEELHDLLDPATCMATESMTQYMMQKTQKEISIREEKEGQISVYGLQEEKIDNPQDLFSCLERGSNFRSTSATLMNAWSSRSHAIFTITIEQHIIEDLYQTNEIPRDAEGNPMKAKAEDPTTREEFMVAKFHFVDLAGSERIKKTGATGTTMKEGISINKGLLCLGNVISALTDESKRVFHVPYRDSKLTRILQDSLGGNSRTIMLACISPAEYNYEESLNTLKYAARARNIKNKPIVNRDPNSALIAQLRQNVYELQRDIIVYKKTLLSNEIEIPKDVVVTNEEMQMEFSSKDLRNNTLSLSSGSSPPKRNTTGGQALSGREIMEFEYQIRDLKIEASKKEKTINKLEIDLDLAKEEAADIGIKYFACQRERDLLKLKWEKFQKILKDNGLMDQAELDQQEEQENDEIKLIEEFHEKIEDYKNQSDSKEKLLRNLRSENLTLQKNFDEESKLLKEKVLLCEKLKRDLKNLEKENINLQKKSKLSPSELHAERMRIARNGKTQYMTLKEQRKEELKSVMKHGRRVKKHQEWLSKELGNTIENFNEMFISNLSLSLTQIFVDKDKQKQIESQQTQDFNEEGEEEEEEGDHIYEVEVVGQQAEDREKATKIDHSISIEGDPNVEEEKVEPNAEENINQVISQNQEAQVKDKEMADQLNEQEKAVIKIEGSLHERERLLKAVKESHSLMQNTLLEEMRNEYFKKVKEMESQITKLKSDHKLSIRSASTTDKSNLESNYKAKLAQLEKKMKHFKVKEKEQKKIEKEWVKQSNKIKSLENDIQKMRNQKISLNRKFKEHEEKYKKWKLAKGSELLNSRKMNVMKDRQISKLTREKRKNELIAQRNAAELKVLKKKRKQEEAQRKKSEMIRRKRLKPGANKRRIKGKGKKKAMLAQQLQQKTALAVEIEKVREWIEANVEKMVTVKHLSKDIKNFRLQKNQIEAEIEDEQKYYSEISIKKEKAIMKRGKIKMENEEGECLILDKDIEEYDSILHKNQENIESLEDKIGYFDKRISSLESAIDEVNNEDIKGLDLEKVDSVQSAKTLLVAFFNILLEVKVQKVNLEDTLVEQHSSIKDLEKEIKILRDSKKAGEIQFNKALQEREKEFLELESKLLQETEEKINETKIQMSTNSEIISLESRRTQKKKLEKNFSTEAYEDSKRKLSKMMTQLERKLLVEEKKNLTMSNMVDQSKAEKEQYKQKYNNLRKKIKQDEIHQIKISKLGGIESSGYQGGGQLDQNYGSNKLIDYKDIRKDRKITNTKTNLEHQDSTPYTEMANNILAPDIPVLKEAKSTNFKRKSLVFGEQTNSNVFDRLMNQSTITSKIKERPPVPREGEMMTSPTLVERADTFSAAIEGIDQSELIINWDFSVENAHNGPIYSITNIENQLYTSSKGSLKIWDIDTMTNISDISAHSGIIRSLCVLPEQKLLAAACEKYIILWDLVSLTNVATLKSHQGDINMLKRGDNILLSGGASGFDSSPTLYAWDLRTSNPVEERETTEVQWIEVWNKDTKAFVGNTSQLVKSISLNGGTSEALSPPHNDIVTSLCQYRGVLVSASKDKSMRFWDMDSYEVMLSNQNAHKSPITCMDSDEYFIYSGDKDNIIKSWQFKELTKDQESALEESKKANSKDKDISDLEQQFGKYRAEMSSLMVGHTAQVNSICAMNDEYWSLFTGGNDKSLKLWRK